MNKKVSKFTIEAEKELLKKFEYISKQKGHSVDEEVQQKMKEKIGIKNGKQLKGKKILILDDVITSGNTLLTCLSLVLLQKPQCVELLVLSTKKDIEVLSFDEGEK